MRALKIYILIIALFMGIDFITSAQTRKNTETAKRLFQRQPLVKGGIFKAREVKSQCATLRRESGRAINFLMVTPFKRKKTAEKTRNIILDEIFFIRDFIYDQIKEWFFNQKLRMESIKGRFPQDEELQQIYQSHQLDVIYKEDSVTTYIDTYTDSLYNFIENLSLVKSNRGYSFKNRNGR